jgi:hypothetical protein
MSRAAISREEPTQTAARACRAFAEALSAGLPELAAACFAPNGCLLTPDATAVHGREDICLVLVQLVALHAQVEVQSSGEVEAGELALVRQRWKIALKAPGEEQIVQSTSPAFVLRRVEAEWKLAIAAPWGTGEGTLQAVDSSRTGASE